MPGSLDSGMWLERQVWADGAGPHEAHQGRPSEGCGHNNLISPRAFPTATCHNTLPNHLLSQNRAKGRYPATYSPISIVGVSEQRASLLWTSQRLRCEPVEAESACLKADSPGSLKLTTAVQLMPQAYQAGKQGPDDSLATL